MRLLTCLLIISVALTTARYTTAQPHPANPVTANAVSVEAMVARMMAFDKNKDGKLTREEVTDERLQRLFDRADVNKHGYVTREELTALFTKELAAEPKEIQFGGPGGFAPPQPGVILPPFVQNMLKLTDDQKKQVADLQKEVDTRLDKILTDDQKKQLKSMPSRGPGGRGPGGGGPPGAPPSR